MTGELAFKPVLRTTVRSPRKLLAVRTADETLACTGGHMFWVSGEGWVRARDLKSGYLLHCPTGAARVVEVAEHEEAETYNLVVDGFHSYFVAHERLLVHDVTLPQFTTAPVPGFNVTRAIAADTGTKAKKRNP